MHNKVVLDSSVFNKLFLQEDDRQQAIDLFTALTEKIIALSCQVCFCMKCFLSQRLAASLSLKAYELIVEFQKKQLQLIELDGLCIEKTFEICEAGHSKSGFPSFYNTASYHALAINNDCDFVTADKRHFNKTLQWGHIVLLSDWEKVFPKERA